MVAVSPSEDWSFMGFSLASVSLNKDHKPSVNKCSYHMYLCVTVKDNKLITQGNFMFRIWNTAEETSVSDIIIA